MGLFRPLEPHVLSGDNVEAGYHGLLLQEVDDVVQLLLLRDSEDNFDVFHSWEVVLKLVDNHFESIYVVAHIQDALHIFELDLLEPARLSPLRNPVRNV